MMTEGIRFIDVKRNINLVYVRFEAGGKELSIAIKVCFNGKIIIQSDKLLSTVYQAENRELLTVFFEHFVEKVEIEVKNLLHNSKYRLLLVTGAIQFEKRNGFK